MLGIALPAPASHTRARRAAALRLPIPNLKIGSRHLRSAQTQRSQPNPRVARCRHASARSETEPASLVPDNRLFALGGAASVASLFWSGSSLPDQAFLATARRCIWTGPKKNAVPLYSIAVTPGNITVRRNSDQLIVARVAGMKPDKAQLFAHFQSAAGWEPVAMQPAPDAEWQRSLSICSRGSAGECRILCRRGAARFAALQSPRCRSSFREGHSRHLSLSRSGQE